MSESLSEGAFDRTVARATGGKMLRVATWPHARLVVGDLVITDSPEGVYVSVEMLDEVRTASRRYGVRLEEVT